jgi:hypothetical protein
MRSSGNKRTGSQRSDRERYKGEYKTAAHDVQKSQELSHRLKREEENGQLHGMLLKAQGKIGHWA